MGQMCGMAELRDRRSRKNLRNRRDRLTLDIAVFAARLHDADASKMRVAFLTIALVIGAVVGARADCLQELGQLREQVDTMNAARPTAPSQAAARELQKLERSESADEVDCYNTVARARKILASPLPPAADDRYAKDQQRR